MMEEKERDLIFPRILNQEAEPALGQNKVAGKTGRRRNLSKYRFEPISF